MTDPAQVLHLQWQSAILNTQKIPCHGTGEFAQMTDQRDEAGQEPNAAGGAHPETRPGVSRRTLLRGATVALPTVLTLNSGAALALSSFKLTASATPGKIETNYVCLDTTDLSGPPYPIEDKAYITGVPDAYGYVDINRLQGIDLNDSNAVANEIKRAGIVPIAPDKMCSSPAGQYIAVSIRTNGKWYPYQPGGSTKIGTMPTSANMSVSAFNSLKNADKISSTFLV